MVVELKDIFTSFGPLEIHKGISLTIDEGETVTILGASGSGKTLILRLIIGLLRPTNGTVTVLGSEISRMPEQELAHIRTNIGMLFQGAALFDSLSVFENIAYGLREHGEKDEEKIREIVQQKLSVVGLPDVGQKLPSELSGGQKKRIGLARAIATSPKIMLYDEPTTGLDPTSTRMIDDLIMRLQTELRMTSIAVTHDIASAKRISNRWILLKDGKVAADGPPDTIVEQSEVVRNFVTGRWEEQTA